MTTLLLIDDDPDFTFGLRRLLEREGHEVLVAASGAAGLEAAAPASHDLVILDLGLPDTEGLELLEAFLARDPATPVIVSTGQDDATLAVKAIRMGASDYLVKPVGAETLHACVASALERATLRRSLLAMRRQRGEQATLVGRGVAMRRVLGLLERVAAAKAPVLITGESGTGKEVAATLIHTLSLRRDGPFVTVNASCLPRDLVESELFGHEAGAFTGAKTARRGLFELAAKGTLFLDEIGELPLDLQPKLLRVLEGHPFRRVGSEQDRSADVRVVAATHRNLKAMVEEGRFRQDLYFRLKVLEVELPPLRERMEDLPDLVAHFLTRMAPEHDPVREPPDPDLLQALRRHAWPGNVRELKNALERAVILSGGGSIRAAHLPPDLLNPACQPAACPLSGATLQSVATDHAVKVWMEMGRNLTRTAETLGISRVTLRQRLRSAGVYPERN